MGNCISNFDMNKICGGPDLPDIKSFESFESIEPPRMTNDTGLYFYHIDLAE